LGEAFAVAKLGARSRQAHVEGTRRTSPHGRVEECRRIAALDLDADHVISGEEHFECVDRIFAGTQRSSRGGPTGATQICRKGAGAALEPVDAVVDLVWVGAGRRCGYPRGDVQEAKSGAHVEALKAA